MFLAIFIAFIITLVLCEGAFWLLACSICERAIYPLRVLVCIGPGVLLNKSKHSLVLWTSLPFLLEKNWQLLSHSFWLLLLCGVAEPHSGRGIPPLVATHFSCTLP